MDRETGGSFEIEVCETNVAPTPKGPLKKQQGRPSNFTDHEGGGAEG